MEHVFVGSDVLCLWLWAAVLKPGLHGPNLVPERRKVGYEVFDDLHVTYRFNDNWSAVRWHSVYDLGVAGKPSMSVDTHGAGAAYRAATGTSQSECAVHFFANLDQSVQHSVRLGHFKFVFLEMRCGPIRVGIKPSDF